MSHLKKILYLTNLLSTTICWCGTNWLIFPSISLAQETEVVPTLPSFPSTPQDIPPSPDTNYLPEQIPPGTFDSDSDFIPPKNISPPLYRNDDPSNAFNIYYLDEGDGVSVNVERFPDFNTSSRIDPEGNLVMPIVGRISLIGLTVEQAETKISNILGQLYLKNNPKVRVILIAPRSVKLTIVGEVSRPGFYNVGPGSPVDGILQRAGGGTRNADLRSVIIRRRLPDDSVIERRLDLFTPLQTGEELPNVNFQGGDTIIVSKLGVGEDQDYNRDLIAKTSLVQQSITVRLWNEGSGGIRAINVRNGTSALNILGSVGLNNEQLADIRNIALLRFDSEKGGIITQTIDAKRAIRGDIAQDLILQDEDIIIIGRTLLGKVIDALDLVSTPFQSVFSFLAFFNTLDRILD